VHRNDACGRGGRRDAREDFAGESIMNLKLTLLVAAAWVPALGLADPAETQIVGHNASAPSVVVHYGDLDISTPEGARKRHERLSTAAWQVCSHMLTRVVSIEGGKCRMQLIEAAVSDIHRQQRLAYGQDAPILR
jgi:UrcA family protein